MSIFDEIIAIKECLEAMKPDSWIDFILLTTEPFQDMLFRVEHEDKWYLIVNKIYFETKVKPEIELRPLLYVRDGPVIPLGIPVFENDELLQEILESVTFIPPHFDKT